MYKIVLTVISVVLITLVLLQSGKSEGFSSAFTGNGSLNLFANTKERGTDKIFSRVTFCLIVCFFALVLLGGRLGA